MDRKLIATVAIAAMGRLLGRGLIDAMTAGSATTKKPPRTRPLHVLRTVNTERASPPDPDSRQQRRARERAAAKAAARRADGSTRRWRYHLGA